MPATARFCLLICAIFLLMESASAQLKTVNSQSVSQANYPAKWDVRVPEGTALAQIRDSYEQRRSIRMMASDLEDQSPLPFWFRAYLRDQLQNLPTTGIYQYPRVADQILEWMLAHPDLPSGEQKASTRLRRAAAIPVPSGTNINLTNFDERNSESSIAVDYGNPLFVVAASNNIATSGHQKQFYSADGGKTWQVTELPLAAGTAFQSDPALAFASDGTVWAATLGINAAGSSVQVQIFKSTNHGASWSFVSTVSSGNNNDKEMIAVDGDRIYVVWDVPGAGMRFATSLNGGATWSGVTELSHDTAIGSDVWVGADHELYVAWPDTTSRQLRIVRSTDAGAQFGAVQVIATTTAAFEISVPPMCRRNALVYLSAAADKSTARVKNRIYASWTDLNGSSNPGCNSGSGTAEVYVNHSDDGGNTWSEPVRVTNEGTGSDRFNQWLDVDRDDGTVYLSYYDTKGDGTRHTTNLYLSKSTDGGQTWADTKVTSSATDETVADADQGNQYGDYNGLVAYKQVVHISWTDRRSGVPGNKEQIFSNTPQ
jgi:BNR/Asp-box repeat